MTVTNRLPSQVMRSCALLFQNNIKSISLVQIQKTASTLHPCSQVSSNFKFLITFHAACLRGYDQSEEEAKTSRIIIVRALIESGADFNYQKKGTLLTPLHWAAFNNDLEVVNLLISKEADLKFSDMLESPLTVAGNCRNLTVYFFFLK